MQPAGLMYFFHRFSDPPACKGFSRIVIVRLNLSLRHRMVINVFYHPSRHIRVMVTAGSSLPVSCQGDRVSVKQKRGSEAPKTKPNRCCCRPDPDYCSGDIL